MRLHLLYFAWVRERIGLDGETRDLDARTVGEVLSTLAALGDGYAAAFAEPHRLRFALDQDFVGEDAPLRDGAELAIFPPVTGG
jgi:molybdopterin synthase sulfur carrier subunit